MIDSETGMQHTEPKGPEIVRPPTVAQVFEHLFPGNEFKALQRFDPKNLHLLWKLYTLEKINRAKDLDDATDYGEELAVRENFPHPDQLTAPYYFGGNITLAGSATHPTMFQDHSFSDLIEAQQGERLGGAATRPVTLLLERWTHYSKLPGKKPETLLGVLDNQGKPTAIIHFMEGQTPRQPKRVEEPALIRAPGLVTVRVDAR